MTYDRFIHILNARGMFRIRPDLDRVRKVMRVMGHPQDQFPSIHIAGTNGKGSVAAALESVLRASGYRTGLYTSPHLTDLRERIQINGVPLEKGFTELAEQVLAAEKRAKAPLTYFELVTAIAFAAFAKQNIDVGIIECGLGGLWDATNVLKKPLLSIITSIGLDHTQWLGRQERQIAVQKAGILKPHGTLISGVRGAGRAAVLRVAREREATIDQIDEQFTAESLTSSWRSGQQVIRFRYRGEKSEDVAFGLLGVHQADNAALVLAALRRLKLAGWSIPAAKQAAGMRLVSWPGRLQLIRYPHRATLLLDGAHNPPAMKSLAAAIQSSPFSKAPKTFIFSAFHDKDYISMARVIKPLAREIFLCAMNGKRGATITQLRTAFKSAGHAVHQCPSVTHALQAAFKSTPPEGLIVITGSLAFVGKTLKELSVQPSHRGGSLAHV